MRGVRAAWCAILALGCDGGERLPVDGGRDQHTVEVCVDEACDETGGPDESEGVPGACPDVFEAVYPVVLLTDGVCSGYDPGDCAVEQDSCSVRIACEHYPAVTAPLGADGVTDTFQLPIGDGVIADCSAAFGDLSLSLTCAAYGVTCEWGVSLM